MCEEFYKSGITIQGVDHQELDLYLSLCRSEQYLAKMGILKYCPRRRIKRGAPPDITGSGININKGERFKPWIRPTRKPGEEAQKVVTREGLNIVITVIIKNHVYNFNGELRKQKEGGAIGMDITGEIAKIFMTWRDKQLLRLNKLNINPFLYKRYVDDISIGVKAIEEGYEYVKGGLNRSEEERMNNIPRDQRTFDIIRRVGDDMQKEHPINS